jgi:hypothetical protein
MGAGKQSDTSIAYAARPACHQEQIEEVIKAGRNMPQSVTITDVTKIGSQYWSNEPCPDRSWSRCIPKTTRSNGQRSR